MCCVQKGQRLLSSGKVILAFYSFPKSEDLILDSIRGRENINFNRRTNMARLTSITAKSQVAAEHQAVFDSISAANQRRRK